jgi:stress response protein SCP2
MAKGANVPVASAALRSTLHSAGGAGVPDVDVAALLLRANGKVSGEDDFVFYNHPYDVLGTVRHLGKAPGAFVDALEIDLSRIPGEVERVVLVASADGGSFGQVPGLVLVLSDRVTGTDLVSFAMQATVETAFVGGELYRSAGGWKFRAVGQGYESGLAGLATDFGIVIDESPDAAEASVQLAHEPEPAAPLPPAAAPVYAPPPPPPADWSAAPPPPAAPVYPPPPPPADWSAAPPQPPAAPPPMPPTDWAQAPGSPVLPPTAPPPAPEYLAPPVSAYPAPPIAPPPAPEYLPPPAAQQYEPPVPAAPIQAAPVQPAPTSTLGPMQRGDRRPLASPDGQPIARLLIGLGWAAAQAGKDVDLDASAITFDAEGKKDEIVWRRHLSEYSGALQHMGDNRSGSAAGTDAEAIVVDLPRVPGSVDSMVFTINSMTGDRFTDLAYAYLRLVDQATGYEVARFDLADTQPSTAVIMAMIKRQSASGGWEMRAIGEFHDTRYVKKLVDASERHARMP